MIAYSEVFTHKAIDDRIDQRVELRYPVAEEIGADI